MPEPFQILVMPGEGIGPEVLEAAGAVLRCAIEELGIEASISEFEVGLPAFEKTSSFLPQPARELIDRLCNSPRAAILFGATADEPIGILRKRYDLFLNLRPIRPFRVLSGISPLRAELAADVDMMIVRELVSGIYYGQADSGGEEGARWASQEMRYQEHEARRLLRAALRLAMERRRKLTFVHKENVIKGVFGLWMDVLREEARNFPAVEIEDLLVDTMAMQMVLTPRAFDVVACTNMFGDILSDIGAAIVGSIGLLPSASINAAGFALYEPVGGTAPGLAGKQRANPIAAVLSVAMLCRHTFRKPEMADLIYGAVEKALERNRTSDIAEPGCRTVSTSEMGALIAAELRAMTATAGRGASNL